MAFSREFDTTEVKKAYLAEVIRILLVPTKGPDNKMNVYTNERRSFLDKMGYSEEYITKYHPIWLKARTQGRLPGVHMNEAFLAAREFDLSMDALYRFHRNFLAVASSNKRASSNPAPVAKKAKTVDEMTRKELLEALQIEEGKITTNNEHENVAKAASVFKYHTFFAQKEIELQRNIRELTTQATAVNDTTEKLRTSISQISSVLKS